MEKEAARIAQEIREEWGDRLMTDYKDDLYREFHKQFDRIYLIHGARQEVLKSKPGLSNIFEPATRLTATTLREILRCKETAETEVYIQKLLDKN